MAAEAELKPFFKNGTSSIEKLNQWLADREAFWQGLLDFKADSAVLMRQIDSEMLTRVRNSQKEVGSEFRPLKDLLTKELNAWVNMKAIILQSGVNIAIESHRRTILELLERERMLLPENVEDKTLKLFLITMGASREAQRAALAKAASK